MLQNIDETNSFSQRMENDGQSITDLVATSSCGGVVKMDVCGAPPAGCGAGGETGSLGAHAGVTPAGTAPLLQPPARPSPPITQPAPAPDGGWGWVVCAGAFMCNVVMDGMLFSFGVFFIELLYCFGESKGRTALVGSMLMGTHLFLGESGPIRTSIFIQMYSYRPIDSCKAVARSTQCQKYSMLDRIVTVSTIQSTDMLS